MTKVCVVAAGGTGGHLFPAQALAEEMARRGWRIVLATDRRGQAFAEHFPADERLALDSATGSGPIGLLKAGVRIAIGVAQARKAFRRLEASVVVGFGGYPSAPSLLAAMSMGLPTLIHEQNAVLGGLVMSGIFSLYFLFDHVRERVAKFLAPGQEDTHQIDRASEAIRAGGLFGRGVGEGVMKRHVPDLHTDFIYSVGAEEFGLILSLVIISLYAFIVLRGLSRAMRLNDPFEQTAAAGLFMLIGLQAAINMAVNLNLIPTKGMTLPFISYGGSSMVAMGLTMGLALALTRRRAGAYEPGTGRRPAPKLGRILP